MENSQKNYSLIKQIALFYVRSQPSSDLKKKKKEQPTKSFDYKTYIQFFRRFVNRRDALDVYVNHC